MSLEVFNSLSEQQQRIMLEVGDELRVRALKIVEESTGKSIEALRSGGAEVVLLPGEEVERWRSLAQPIWNEFASENGAEAKAMLDEANRLRTTR